MVSKRWPILILTCLIASAGAILQRKWRTYAEELVAEPPRPFCNHPEKYEANWILQFSDHFSDLDPTVWRLRFFSNLDHLDFGGPLFVIIGGPWEISPHFVCAGLVLDAARHQRGAVFYLEHRFYGQSHPAKYTSKIGVALLTRSQVIEDIRHFIEYQKAHMLGMVKSKVILVGSHVGGSLAAWTQQKYPILVDGVWATGAPFVSSDHLPRFTETVRRFVEKTGAPECLGQLDQTFEVVKRELEGVTPPEYSEIFEMCPGFDFQSIYDQWTFVYRLFCGITRAVLQNTPRDLYDLCYEMMDPKYLDVVEAFAPHFLSSQRGKGRCVDYSFRHLINETVHSRGSDQQSTVDVWAYQSCSEYGWFPGGGAENKWLPPNFFEALCYNGFSLLKEARADARAETEKLWQGIVHNEDAKIMLSYGLLDPWTGAGIDRLEGEAGERYLLFVQGASFRDTLMQSLNRSDSLEVQGAKMVILNNLEKWTETAIGAVNLVDSGSTPTSIYIETSVPLVWGLLVYLIK